MRWTQVLSYGESGCTAGSILIRWENYATSAKLPGLPAVQRTARSLFRKYTARGHLLWHRKARCVSSLCLPLVVRYLG